MPFLLPKVSSLFLSSKFPHKFFFRLISFLLLFLHLFNTFFFPQFHWFVGFLSAPGGRAGVETCPRLCIHVRFDIHLMSPPPHPNTSINKTNWPIHGVPFFWIFFFCLVGKKKRGKSGNIKPMKLNVVTIRIFLMFVVFVEFGAFGFSKSHVRSLELSFHRPHHLQE